MKVFRQIIILVVMFFLLFQNSWAEDVNIGFSYPQTGPYSALGLAQYNGAVLALEEINSKGGILNRKVKLITRDTQSNPKISTKNVLELIDKEKCEMIFGGVSSAVAIAGGKAAKSRGKLFFGTMTASNATTGVEGHKYIFREGYNAWMIANSLSSYLMEEKLSSKKFFYITADYIWGRTTEKAIRTFSMTTNEKRHKRFYTPFPNATFKDFSNALSMAKVVKPQVLVLLLFGKDIIRALTMIDEMGIKKNFQAILAPTLSLDMAVSVGPKAMENVIGTAAWTWNVPFEKNFKRGKAFVNKYADRYHSYPSCSSGSAYTILHQYKDAVERTGTFDTKAVIKTLEDYKYVSLKDEQTWRAFDHQSVQTVYVMKCRKKEEVLKDKFKQNYFEIIKVLPGNKVVRTKDYWQKIRKEAGKPVELQY